MYGKRIFGERDQNIYIDYLEGKTIAELSDIYKLAEPTLYDCIRRVMEENERKQDPFYVLLDCNYNLYLTFQRSGIHSEEELRQYVGSGKDLIELKGIGVKKKKQVMDILKSRKKRFKAEHVEWEINRHENVSDRDLNIMNLRNRGYTFSEIAKSYGLSKQRVQAICKETKRKTHKNVYSSEYDIRNVIGIPPRVDEYFLIKGIDDIFKAYTMLFIKGINLMDIPGIGAAGRAKGLGLIKNYICYLQKNKSDDLIKMSDYFEAKNGEKPDRVFVSSKEMRLYQMFGYSDSLGMNLVDFEEVHRPSITINDIMSRDAKNILVTSRIKVDPTWADNKINKTEV